MTGFRADIAKRILEEMTGEEITAEAYILRVVGRRRTQNLHLLLTPVQVEFFRGLCRVSQMLQSHPDEPVLDLQEAAQVEFDGASHD